MVVRQLSSSNRERTPRRVALAFALTMWPRSGHAEMHAAVFDDGEKLHAETEHPLPESPYPNEISLFGLPGETVALQFAIESDEPLLGVIASVEPLSRSSKSESESGAPPASAGLGLVIANYSERFVRVARPSGNEREPGSLAFTPAAAPPSRAFIGLLADALIPRPLDLEAHRRGALWVDATIPLDAAQGEYRGEVVVRAKGAEAPIVTRPLRLEVGSRAVPYAATRATVFYDPETLSRRMGNRDAEVSLRQVIHAHHVSAIAERTAPPVVTTSLSDASLDLAALDGSLYTPARGYHGPGEHVGEGVYAIGAYGSLGEPSDDKLAIVESFARAIASVHALDATEAFVYAVDEDCKSTRANRWRALLARSQAPEVRSLLVGVTCGDNPSSQDASLVMLPSPEYDPDAANQAKAAGKHVWAYNGIRPHAGPLMLDVPAVDLRANAWIAMRYDVARWFYWEATFWLDNNKGGKGGRDGWDPYVVAETFHNADGDYALGDGILVYPGTQSPAGMTDDREAVAYPSIRLKNLRRGVLDAGYITLARERNRAATDAVLRRMIPRALARATSRTGWPDDAKAWLGARRELFDILEGPVVLGNSASSGDTEINPRGCGRWGIAGALLALALALVKRALQSKRTRRAQ